KSRGRGCPVRVRFTWHYPHRGGARGGANHWVQILAASVLRPVGIIDPIVEGTLDRLEGDFPRHSGGGGPARRLTPPGLVPARVPMLECHTSLRRLGRVKCANRRPQRSSVVRLSTMALWILSLLLLSNQFDRHIHRARHIQCLHAGIDLADDNDAGGRN